MRQTNNALTFLSASYQAVFKHAYVTGLASSAVMLTLASPYALASVNAEWDTSAQDQEPSNVTFGTTDTAAPISSLLSDVPPLANQPGLPTSGNELTISEGGTYRADRFFNKLIIKMDDGVANSEFHLQAYTNKDTGFYVKDEIYLEKGILKLSGYNNYLQELRGSEKEDAPITGNLKTSGGAIDINQAIMSVKYVDINNTTINIEGLTGSSGQALSDIFANYSSLNTGLGDGAEAGVAKQLSLTLGNQGAFNALGSVNIDGNIFFAGTKDNSVNRSLGEIASKAIFSAKTANLNTKLNVGKDNNGAIFSENLTLSGTRVSGSNINGLLQFAGLVSNSLATDSKNQALEQGFSGADTKYVNTNFSSGTLNLNANLTNSGSITFGANNVTVDSDGKATATPSKYTVNASAALTNKQGGVVNIGEDLADGLTMDPKARAGSGTTYNLSSGKLENYGTLNLNTGSKLNVNSGSYIKNDSKFNVNAYSTLEINSGSFDNTTKGTITLAANSANMIVNGGTVNNQGTINSQKGSTLTFNGGTLKNSGSINVAGSVNLLGDTVFTQSDKSSINLNSGGVLTVDANVLRDQSKDKEQVYDYSSGKYRTKSDLSNSDKIKFAGGSLYLTNGIFSAENPDTNTLSGKIISALNGNKTEWSTAGGLYINDAVLKLSADLNITQKGLAGARIGGKTVNGTNNSKLYTSGDLEFTTLEYKSQNSENMNGFAEVGGSDVTVINNSANTGKDLIIKGNSGSSIKTTLLATSNLTANQAINVQDFKLKFSNEKMLADVSAEGNVPTADFSKASGSIGADINLRSGAALEVEAGAWTSTGALSAAGDALITIDGKITVSLSEDINTNASLKVTSLSLTDNAKANVNNSGSLTAENLAVNGNAQLNVKNGSLIVTSENSGLQISGTGTGTGDAPQVSLTNSSGTLGNVSITTAGTLNATSSTLKIGDMLLSGTANTVMDKTPLKVEQLTINTDSQDNGLKLTDSSFEAQSVNVKNGLLSSLNTTNNLNDLQTFNVTDQLNVTGSGKVTLQNAAVKVGSAKVSAENNSGGIVLNNSTFTSNGDVSINNSHFSIDNNLQMPLVEGNDGDEGEPKPPQVHFTANNLTIERSADVNFTNVNAQLKGHLNLNGHMVEGISKPNSKLTMTGSALTVAGNVTNEGQMVLNNSDLILNGADGLLEITASGSLDLNTGKISANNIALDTNGKLDADTATITTNTLKGKDSATMSFTDTEITLNGDKDESTVDITGNITLNGGTLNLGDALDSLALTYDSSTGFTIGGNIENGGVEGSNTDGTQFKQIQAGQGAVITLDVSQVPGTSGTMTLTQANALADKLFAGNGIVRFEGNTQPIIDSTHNEALNRDEVDFNDIKDLDLNVSTEETRNAVLVNVDNTGTVSSEWKAIETAGDPSFKVGSTAEGKEQTLSILGTTGNNNLAQDKNGNTVGVVLGAGSALNLKASGNIGSIVEDESNDPLSATLTVASNADIKVNPLSGETTSQIKVGKLNSESNIEVDEVVATTASFTSGGLTSDTVELGELTANDATFNVTTFTAGNTIANRATFNTEEFTAGDTIADSSIFKTQEFTAASFSGAGNTIEATNITFTNGGDISANKLTATNTLNLGQKIIASASSFNAKTLKAGSFTDSGSSIKAETVEFGDVKLEGSTLTATTGTFTGTELKLDKAAKVTFGGDIDVAGKLQVIGGSTLTANTLQLGSGDMYIGAEDAALSDTSSTGKVVLKNLDLNGRNLFLDPEFGQAAATMFVNNIGDLADVNSGRYNTQINGNIVVGRNSALGLGGTEAEFNEAIAKHQDSTTKSFKTDGIGAMLYVNRANIQLGDNKLLISTEDIANLKQRLETDSARIYLGDKSGLQVTARAINEAHGTVNGLVFSDLDSKDVIESKDGTLILPAGVNMDDLKSIFGSEVTLAENSKIQVTTENGLFHGVIDSTDDLRGDGDFEFTIDKNARTILSDVSTPTFNYYVNAIANSGIVEQPNSSTGSGSDTSSSGDLAQNGDGQGNTTGDATQNGDNSTSQIALLANNDSAGSSSTGGSTDGETGGSSTGGSANGDTNPDDPNGSGVTPLPQAGAGYLFLSQAGSEKAGRAIEQSARLASFGMSMQIAQQAGKTTSDAIGQRLGMRAPQSSNPSVISNGGTAVWFTPVYKNYSSSSFSADDLNYGTDFDLYGAAVGMDYTFNNGLKVGGLINFGQGDADGSGIASGVSNDFNYYGVGLFASFQPLPDLTLSADATYTVVDNDLETMADVTGYNKITASADSDAFSLGVNAQYDMRALGFNVTPHAGMRYTRMSVDNYTIKADGERIGRTTADSADILSIPVGVALSSEFKAGNWVIQPRADFEVTANFGSDSAGSSTTFDGAVGTANYNTEFMDSITYGVNGGLQMTNGNFSFGANIGYTGSSHTDELNVGANVMFKF